MPSKMPRGWKKPWKPCADLRRKREAVLKKNNPKTKNDPGFTVDYGTASDRFFDAFQPYGRMIFGSFSRAR